MKRFLNYLPSRLYSFRVVEPELLRTFWPLYIGMIFVGVMSAILSLSADALVPFATPEGKRYLSYASWVQWVALLGIALIVWTYVRVQVATDAPRVLLRYASIPEKYITTLRNDDEISTIVSKLAREERGGKSVWIDGGGVERGGDVFTWIDVIDWHIKAREISKAVSHISDKDEAARAAGLLSIGFGIDDINRFGSKQFYRYLVMDFSKRETLLAVRAGIDIDLARTFFQGGMGHTMSLKAAA